jgi:hypothetical protein
MQSKSVYKIPNGKLLKIDLVYDKKNKKIDRISIMGDFFAYPEESIEILEKKLENIILEKETLNKKIESIIKQNKIEFIGLNAEELTTGILMCLK